MARTTVRLGTLRIGTAPVLSAMQRSSEDYLGILHLFLLLATRNPGSAEWEEGAAAFNQLYAPLEVKPMTFPDRFPEHYFLGLLRA